MQICIDALMYRRIYIALERSKQIDCLSLTKRIELDAVEKCMMQRKDGKIKMHEIKKKVHRTRAQTKISRKSFKERGIRNNMQRIRCTSRFFKKY